MQPAFSLPCARATSAAGALRGATTHGSDESGAGT
jgi:hypothetical protein